MKYPTLSCKQDKRFKLCNEDVDKIHQLIKQGVKRKDIAKKFNVSYSAICEIINPRKIKPRKSTWIDKYKNDLKIKEKRKKQHTERYKDDKNYRKYYLELSKEWRNNNPDYFKQWYEKNKDDYNKLRKMRRLQRQSQNSQDVNR